MPIHPLAGKKAPRSLLANIPSQPSEGRAGFVALVRTVLNAVLSTNFNFAQIRDLMEIHPQCLQLEVNAGRCAAKLRGRFRPA